ncbi:MAG: virulence RhuM family protein [Firmicutes bacterium]|nr:virulence RhuM family protein [Bacillota bacterium]
MDNQIILYTSADGKTKVQVNIDPNQNTVWLTQAQMSELFDVDVSGVSRHIANVFETGELDPNGNLQKLQITKFKPTEHYSLNVVLAVGYRVNSLRGTQFRIWATEILEEYVRKGFAMNDELLKRAGGGNYFKELISRIRDIRSSEKVFYRQILDIYATSVDYDPKAETTREFFKIVQNKMHFAVHGKTAAELIVGRANAELPFMGLTAFKGNKPTKDEATIAKNYLNEKEITQLNRIVSMYLDYAEDQAEQEQAMKMTDWIEKLDMFLRFNKKELLTHAGTISHENAMEHATGEYEKYKEKTRLELTQAEEDFLATVHETYRLLENKKPK